MTRVLVPVDDDPAGVETVAAARRLFGEDATYLVLTVAPEPTAGHRRVDPSPVGIPLAGAAGPVVGLVPNEAFEDHSAVYDAAEREAATQAAVVASSAGAPEAEVLGRTGDPVHTIVAAAEARDADVIVLHRVERRGLAALVGRSAPDAIARSTRVPVLFLP